MSGPIQDDEYVPRYRRGFEWFAHIARTEMANRPWRRLGIFSFHDSPYVESDTLYLSPKQVLLAMAAISRSPDTAIVMVVDAMEREEMGLSTRQGFNQFIELYDSIFPGAFKLYFGPKDSDRTWLHDQPSLKIPLEWMIRHPNLFAEVLSDASPVGEIVSPADASFEDYAGMIEILKEKLGPPSLSEEVLGKIRSTEASEYAGEVVGLMTVFISPTVAVTRGVKYLGKFVNMLKDRRRQEVKEVYAEWTKRIEEGYTEEKLRQFFDDDPSYDSGLLTAVKQKRPALIVLETRGTLYDMFVPLILQQLVEEVGYVPPHLRPRRDPRSSLQDSRAQGAPTSEDTASEFMQPVEPSAPAGQSDFEGLPKVVLFLDAATHLSKFNRSFKFALNLPERFPNMSVAASFFTERDKISKALEDGVVEYMSERALVFDLHPHLFDDVTGNIPVSLKAWLIGELQKMEQIHSQGGVAFLEYYAPEKRKWTLRVVEKPTPAVVREIRRWFHLRSH
ncbi:MAG: hypothetical protein QXQ81_08690 [Candidatus Thorarchaeota archaeon]